VKRKAKQPEDENKLKVPYAKKISTTDLGLIWAAAYYALKDNGMNFVLEDMQNQLAKSETQQQSLKIIQQFVKFV
jgi:hypothetical protein